MPGYTMTHVWNAFGLWQWPLSRTANWSIAHIILGSTCSMKACCYHMIASITAEYTQEDIIEVCAHICTYVCLLSEVSPILCTHVITQALLSVTKTAMITIQNVQEYCVLVVCHYPCNAVGPSWLNNMRTGVTLSPGDVTMTSGNPAITLLHLVSTKSYRPLEVQLH